ncbi:tetratricopeptide repeat protein [Salinimicrobium gaetbulicola]|uniref:Tetratricopeptide repeat protein n=1 Tax=Salinimicrobium gaetbulicola TaxID=999702 RepID=A0ABW3IEZ8_9FLAO
MKQIICLLSMLLMLSCKQEKEQEQPEPIKDNAELAEIYAADQGDRRSDNLDWSRVSKRDSLRRVRVHQLLDSNKVVTSNDYKNAAMVFQHGKDSVDYGMAVKLMERSVALDSTANKWLLAAATDRYLLSIGEPQIYGTQYHRKNGEPWKLAEMDTTKITDAERMEFGVETLAEQKEKVKRMNQKPLVVLYDSGTGIDQIVELIKNEDETLTGFNVSENGLNNFGYQLMGQDINEEALKIFQLNTELYPEAYNTYDSYGECLLKMGDKENAVIAYQKSLELNPDNDNAKEVLQEIK